MCNSFHDICHLTSSNISVCLRRSSKYMSVNMHECKINHLEQPPGNKLVVVLIGRWGDLFYETLEWRE